MRLRPKTKRRRYLRVRLSLKSKRIRTVLSVRRQGIKIKHKLPVILSPTVPQVPSRKISVQVLSMTANIAYRRRRIKRIRRLRMRRLRFYRRRRIKRIKRRRQATLVKKYRRYIRQTFKSIKHLRVAPSRHRLHLALVNWSLCGSNTRVRKNITLRRFRR